MLEVISVEATDAINRSFDILRARIDKFGVSQPNIQKLETAGRILVELPGVKRGEYYLYGVSVDGTKTGGAFFEIKNRIGEREVVICTGEY